MDGGLRALERSLVAAFGRERVRAGALLGPICSWGAGGAADLLFTAQSAEDLLRAARICREAGPPLTLLGGGANVLVSDRGIRGLVVRNRAERVESRGDAGFEAESGALLTALARRALDARVAGFEFLVGIPGTVGGAVVGNAGTRARWFSEVLESVLLLGPDGQVRREGPEALRFGYRDSRVKRSGEVVLSAVVRGTPDEPSSIARRMAAFLEQRRGQPAGPSAGSVFRNPPGDFAGRLIESCGLKGRRIGGAEISRMHANFILNTGAATARDIRSLVEVAKEEVARRAGVALEEEIRYLGEWP
ncbi:MAG TPA: UDP-N-acetylmuramate dehydrogenase [Planctomycetota bacterium]|jgi:UDP-N-acetylmuramate dehydrogenase|nr:UDP-N-acetylmuramate dehydrogenase [Planctomycetota bacterium]